MHYATNIYGERSVVNKTRLEDGKNGFIITEKVENLTKTWLEFSKKDFYKIKKNKFLST